jgi:hypothetical protein
LKLNGEVIRTIPTIGMMAIVSSTNNSIGFNVENVLFKNINYNIWDFGSRRPNLSMMAKYYAEGANALVFVVDSNE